MSETVEWGSDRGSRLRERIGQRASAVASRAGISLALGLLALAFLVASTVMPWARIVLQFGASTPAEQADLGQLNTLLVINYHLAWTIVLGLAGAAMVARPVVRRSLLAAALGASGGLLMLLISLVKSIRRAGEFGDLGGNVTRQVDLTEGTYAAFVALALIIVALVLRLRIPPAEVQPVPSGPATADPAPPQTRPGDETPNPMGAPQITVSAG